MNRLIKLTAALALAFAMVAPVAVTAQQVSAQEQREAARARALERAESRETRVAEIKQEVAERKAQVKQDVCERRQEQLQARLPRLAQSVTTLQGVMDGFYTRVVGFYESGQLTVSNYDELVEAVELAKANAASSAEAIESYEFELDCEAEDAGAQLDGYRTAVREARDSLKTYRQALVDLISSMRAAAAEAESGDESNTKDETENETTVDATNETEGGETEQ